MESRSAFGWIWIRKLNMRIRNTSLLHIYWTHSPYWNRNQRQISVCKTVAFVVNVQVFTTVKRWDHGWIINKSRTKQNFNQIAASSLSIPLKLILCSQYRYWAIPHHKGLTTVGLDVTVRLEKNTNFSWRHENPQIRRPCSETNYNLFEKMYFVPGARSSRQVEHWTRIFASFNNKR
jgi:outer membrane usher protein FimD/PapC